jgi:hypothetical protein
VKDKPRKEKEKEKNKEKHKEKSARREEKKNEESASSKANEVASISSVRLPKPVTQEKISIEIGFTDFRPGQNNQNMTVEGDSTGRLAAYSGRLLWEDFLRKKVTHLVGNTR